MSWFRFYRSPATLSSRLDRHCPVAGIDGGAQARVCTEDRCWTESNARYLGRHRHGSLANPRGARTEKLVQALHETVRSASMLVLNSLLGHRRHGIVTGHGDPERDKLNKNYILSTLLVDNELLAFTATRCKILSVHSNFRTIMTCVSVGEQEVTKTLDLFLSTVKDVLPTNEICSIYIESLCRSSNLGAAVYLLSYLHDREIHLTLNTYNILLAAASEASNFNIFSEIFKNLLISDHPPNFSSYVNVAKAFQKVDNPDELLKFIMEVSKITVDRDPSVMNRILFSTAKSGQFDKSMVIYEELKIRGCKMDQVTFNTVLALLGRAGRVDQMLSEFTVMKDLGYAPDIITYNTLINCLRRLGRLSLCKAFTREMIERGIELDLRTYTSLIDGFGRAGHVKEALGLFEEMKKSHRPSVYVYRALISDLKKVGKFELALNLAEEMNSNISNLVGPTDFKQKKGKRNISRVSEGNPNSFMNTIE